MSDERRRAAFVLRDIVHAFQLPPDWPILITKVDGDLTFSANDLVRRIDKAYPLNQN